MSKNQKVAFWLAFIGFCVVATATIYPQGAFNHMDFGGALILVLMYLVCAFFIHRYIKKNPSEVEKWFQK
nr:hypothetical protein [uncultured Shewanella sp.]